MPALKLIEVTEANVPAIDKAPLNPKPVVTTAKESSNVSSKPAVNIFKFATKVDPQELIKNSAIR